MVTPCFPNSSASALVVVIISPAKAGLPETSPFKKYNWVNSGFFGSDFSQAILA